MGTEGAADGQWITALDAEMAGETPSLQALAPKGAMVLQLLCLLPLSTFNFWGSKNGRWRGPG